MRAPGGGGTTPPRTASPPVGRVGDPEHGARATRVARSAGYGVEMGGVFRGLTSLSQKSSRSGEARPTHGR